MDKQLLGHVDCRSAYQEPRAGVRYWVEAKAASKQVLMRQAPRSFGAFAVLIAPVIVLQLSDGERINFAYLNEESTESEIENFTRKYRLTAQQSKWAFAALGILSPALQGGDHVEG